MTNPAPKVWDPIGPKVWESFLTERDKEHLDRSWKKVNPYGFGTKPVLVVIDDFISSLGPRLPLIEAVKVWPTACGLEGWAAVDKTVEVVAAARAASVHVVFTSNRIDGPPNAIPDDARVMGPIDQWHLRYEIVDELKPKVDDFHIEKVAPSAFFGTPLAAQLISWRADTVLLCGNTTSGCVRASTIDATSYRFKVGVIEDCTFDRTQVSHAVNLFDMEHKYADVISSTAAIEYIKSVSQKSELST